MAVAVRYFEFDKTQRDKSLITEDPFLVFSKWHVTRPNQGLSSLALGGKIIDLGTRLD